MNEYPLLLFPSPSLVSRSRMYGGGSGPHVPDVNSNAGRLGPKFTALQNALDGQRIRIQQDAEGANPEEVLVLETAGRIDDFVQAVTRVEGLEWLLEEDILSRPDDDFYVLDSHGGRVDRELSSRLYLISTNSQALNEFVSLYHQFIQSPQARMRQGFGKFKEVFKQLRDIRFWNYRDRLDGSCFFEEWLNNNEAFPDRSIKFQIELWFRTTEQRRIDAQIETERLISECGGRVLSSCVIEEIRYHALLVEAPALSVRQIVEDISEGSLLQCRDIMYFKPSPQVVTSPVDISDVFSVENENNDILPIGEPIIALLDGYPLQNHSLLARRLIIEDPEGFASQYQVEDRRHGTEMASLIIHGDLSSHDAVLDTPLFVQPIMVPDPLSRDRTEILPDDILTVDLVHRMVRRLFERENDAPPAAPSVKIINFSIGDTVRVFHRVMSPLARLLDWLSYKYNVLFVISAGNAPISVPMGSTITVFKSKSQDEISMSVSQELVRKRMELRLLSPAESINNITVGATHSDNSFVPTNDDRVNPYDVFHPALYSPLGGGLKNSIKPDLVYDGGRQFLDESLFNPGFLVPSTYHRAPGIRVAFPDNDLDKQMYDRGTSCSAALISRQVYFCYKEIHELLSSNGLPESHIHLLIKALIVHGCSWDQIEDSIERYLPSSLDNTGIKDIKRQWLGYGYPDFSKARVCSPHRVTALGFGSLSQGSAHFYRLPLPPSIASRRLKRRLVITLSWMSPIAPQNQKYRKARLWIEATDNSRIANERIDVSSNRASRRGTLQHEVFVGNDAFAFQDGDVLGIKINCAEDAGSFEEPIKYAIAVSLEVAEDINVEIYEEVRARMAIPIQITPVTAL